MNISVSREKYHTKLVHDNSLEFRNDDLENAIENHPSTCSREQQLLSRLR